MQIEITSRRAGVLCAFGLALTLTGGVAWANGRAVPPPQANNAQVPGVIVACAKTGTGAMRLSTPAAGCTSGEKLVSWNQAGAAGPTGATGADGKPGISGYEVVQNGSSFSTFPNTGANCPGGKKVLGGGFDTEVAGHPGVRAPWAYTDASMPAGGMTQWFVQMNRVDQNGGGATQFKVQTYAICAFVAG